MNEDNLKSIISSGEQLCHLAKGPNIEEFEKKLPEYTKMLEQYFLDLDKAALTATDIKNLEQLMFLQQKMTRLLVAEKTKISEKLKQLQTGKAMKNTYPQTA